MSNARDIARQLIESNATDIDHGDIGDYISGLDGAAADTEEEFDALVTEVDDLITSATVTVTWDDEPTGGEG